MMSHSIEITTLPVDFVAKAINANFVTSICFEGYSSIEIQGIKQLLTKTLCIHGKNNYKAIEQFK